MTVTDVDLVVVYHNQKNRSQARDLKARLAELEPGDAYTFIGVSNVERNRGFGPGCNYGAWQGDSEFIGFLNPDVHIDGPFLAPIVNTFRSDPDVVICGERFGKAAHELKVWGCRNWVCGACMFVRRSWFEAIGGFDEQFKWGWEETDLIREAEYMGLGVVSLFLPVRHESPVENSKQDHVYKNRHFDAGKKAFFKKWPRNRRRNASNRTEKAA